MIEQIIDVWSLSDVVGRLRDITNEEIEITNELGSKVLEKMKEQYDANHGYNWSAVDAAYRSL